MLLQAAPATTTTQTVGSPITAYWPVMVFFVVAVIFPVLPIVLGRFLRPIKYEKDKMRPYECGIDPKTEAHERFTVRYYIVAMLFLIFDVETIFLLPWAIISMAQHARPKVMGQSADLRAQFTTGAAISTVFAPTVRRIEFMIESTVVRTNPSSCSAINVLAYAHSSAPFRHA